MNNTQKDRYEKKLARFLKDYDCLWNKCKDSNGIVSLVRWEEARQKLEKEYGMTETDLQRAYDSHRHSSDRHFGCDPQFHKGEPKYEYTGKDDCDEFDYNFWHDRIISHRQEVYLTKDGKIDYKRSGWPERIFDIREREARELRCIQQGKEDIKNWKVPTVADIIMSSVNQFLAGVKFRDQYFTYKFPQEYVLNSGMAYRSYIHKEDKDFVWLKFPMKEYMEWNKIGFDDSYYTFNGKSVLLKDLMKKV